MRNPMHALIHFKLLNNEPSIFVFPWFHTWRILGFTLFSMSWVCNCHPSPNILQLVLSIPKIVCWISEIIFWYLTKYLLMCLSGGIHYAIYRLTHTIVLTYLVLCTHVQSTVIRLTTVSMVHHVTWIVFRNLLTLLLLDNCTGYLLSETMGTAKNSADDKGRGDCLFLWRIYNGPEGRKDRSSLSDWMQLFFLFAI